MAEEAVLGYLLDNEEITDSGQFSDEHNLNHDEVVNVIKRLHAFGYVDCQVPPLVRSILKLNLVFGEIESVIYMLLIGN